jgi:TonB family protein
METLSRLVLAFLLNAVWQVGLVAGAAALGAWMLRNGPARYRHALWAVALGTGVLLSLSTLPGSVGGNGERWAGLAKDKAPAAVTMLPPAPVIASLPTQPRVAPRGTRYFSRRDWPVEVSPRVAYAVLACYSLFLLFRLARLCRAWRRTNEVRRSAQARPLPAWMASSVWRCQVALGLGHVPILCSSRVAGPVALGVRQPLIVLPASMLEGGSEEDLASTLCHEMAHIRRHDFLMNLAYEFLYLLISFHPAAALIKRRIDETRELACDEMAAGRLLSTSAYARSLVNLSGRAAGLPREPGADYALGVFDANILEERVMRLLDKRPRPSARLAKVMLAAVLSALTLVGMGATMFSLSVRENSQTGTADRSHPDFSGRWELDKAPSNLPPSSPDDLVQVVDHRDPQLSITTTSKDWSTEFGQNIQKPIALTLFTLTIPQWITTTDGTEKSVKYGPGEFKSKTHWEDDRLVTAWTLERDGKVEIAGEWVRSLAADGRTQTLEVQAHDSQRGGKGEAKLVFVKSSGPTAESFVGTWQGEFQGKTFVVVELRTQGDKLTGTVSPFTIELDQAGNLTKAERGDHGGWDVVQAESQGNGLALQCKDRDTGDIDRFQMRLIGEKEALLSPMGAPESTAGPQPFRLHKVPAQDAPGVGGGVRGGVSDGIPGGVVRTVSQNVKGDPNAGTPAVAGIVFDPSGARVPNAVVNVMNDYGVVRRVTATNDVGEFAFAVLPPDQYQLEVIGPGFAAYHQRIRLPGGDELHPPLNVLLQPGSMTESVEVTAKAEPGTRSATPSGPPHRIRVGGLVQAGKLIEQKKPEYPEKARVRGTEGAVLLEAVISMEGIPLNWKVLSSPDPDLSEAAIEAVRQWRYEPTLLNGEPIEVVTTISVRFRLEDASAGAG